MARLTVTPRGISTRQRLRTTAAQLPSSAAIVAPGSNNLIPTVYVAAASGDSTGATDYTNVQAAVAALPTVDGIANVGIVQFEAGHYYLNQTLTHGRGQIFRGAGGQADGASIGTTTILFTNNGQGWLVPNNLYRWGIEDLTILGQVANATQDLVTIGNATGATGPGYLRNVGIQKAGRDNLVLASALNVNFDNCDIELAQRYNVYAPQLAAGTNNQLRFSRCRIRLAQQWGIRWSGGRDTIFDNCDIESNSQSTSASYGGALVDAATGTSNVTFSVCHFESNAGAVGGGQTGIPLSVAAPNVNSTVTELGTSYSETNACSLTGGSLTSVGISTNINPHCVIANNAAVNTATFVGSTGNGTNFVITDNKKAAVVVNPRGAPGTITAPGTVTMGAGLVLGYVGDVYTASITPDASVAYWHRITATNNTPFTINAPANPPDANHSGVIVIEIGNTAGSAMGAITWNGIYKFVLGAWTNPATGFLRYAKFEWNAPNTRWICTAMATVDY